MGRVSILLGALLLFSSIGAESAVLVVDPDGSGTFLKIQDAIDWAQNGDEVVVYPGTYVENLDFLGKAIVVRSAVGPSETVVDAGSGPFPNGSGVRFDSGETQESVLEGLRFVNGNGTYYNNTTRGAGAFCNGTSPVIRDCEFINNQCGYAGAIYIDNGGPLIEGCKFINNFVTGYGSCIAGPNAQHVTIRECVFEDNFTPSGGGAIHLGAPATIDGCIFRRNQAHSGAAINSPGAGADFLITRCVFEDNRAHTWHGGGIRVHEATCIIEECLFVGNSAGLDGGGVFLIDGGRSTVRGCTFYGNWADRNGGNISIYNDVVPTIENNIIAESQGGGGVHCSSSYPTFTCNDAWSNTGGNYAGGCSDPTGYNGNISADPLFCDAENGDFTLDSSSPCAPDNSDGCGLIGAFDVGCGDIATDVGGEVLAGGLRFRAGPNPFSGALEMRLTGGEGEALRDLRLDVFAPTGRRVWTSRLPSGGSPLIWDGTDGRGRKVNSGVYYIRLVRGSQPLLKRAVIRID